MASSLSFAALNGSHYLSLDWTCTPIDGCFRQKFSGHQLLSRKRILPYAGETITYRPYHILTLNNVYLSEIHMRLYFLDSKMEHFKSVNRQLMHVKSGKIPKNVLIFSRERETEYVLNSAECYENKPVARFVYDSHAFKISSHRCCINSWQRNGPTAK